jgi:hypothetical protein
MVSIPHYEDLNLNDFLSSLDLQWVATEKLDGSYICAGLDDQGHFYTKSKGGKPCYAVDDWSNECWTASYKVAHQILEGLIEILAPLNLISRGQFMGFEILSDTCLNVIPYTLNGNVNGALVLTTTSWKPATNFHIIVGNYMNVLPVKMLQANKHGQAEYVDKTIRWRTYENINLSTQLIFNMLRHDADTVKRTLMIWLSSDSGFKDLSIREVLDSKLNLFSKSDRLVLDFLRENLRFKLLEYKKIWKRNVFQRLLGEIRRLRSAGTMLEGFVITTPNFMFKVVDVEKFAAANHFVHRVKYAIVGGRRPRRPSFLSRTQHWPRAQRLARLEKLRQRYMKKRWYLDHVYEQENHRMLLSYIGDLHQKTLNMFLDTRMRIENGR